MPLKTTNALRYAMTLAKYYKITREKLSDQLIVQQNVMLTQQPRSKPRRQCFVKK